MKGEIRNIILPFINVSFFFFCIGRQYLSCDWSMAPLDEAKGWRLFLWPLILFLPQQSSPWEGFLFSSALVHPGQAPGGKSCKPQQVSNLKHQPDISDAWCSSLHSWKPLQEHLKLSWRILQTQGKSAWMTHMSPVSLQPNKKNPLGQHLSSADRKTAQMMRASSWKQCRQASPQLSLPPPFPFTTSNKRPKGIQMK